jgi:two-component system, NtrC family, sensor kinase
MRRLKSTKVKGRKVSKHNAPKIARRNPSRRRKKINVAELIRERDEALEQQKATSKVLSVISSSAGELEPVFNALLSNATRLCEASFGNLFLREGPVFRPVALHNTKGYDELLRHSAVIDLRENPGVPLDRVVKTKQVVNIPDLRTDQSYVGKNKLIIPLVEVVGARSFVAVPMLRDGELVGTFNMYRQEARPFTKQQIQLAETFAAQAVIAIENARLLSELRERTDDLTESLAQQTATSEVLQVISSSPGEVDAVFNSILDNAVRICGARFGNLALFDGTEMRLAASHNAPDEFARGRPNGSVIPLDISPLGTVVLTKKRLHITDLALEERYAKSFLVRLAGARSMLAVPMVKDNELIGAINIYRQEVRPFADKQIEVLENFAAQAVIAIENARLLNELRQRTDDLSESLEQQTATSEVLKVISSSPGELDPVFEAMLENAVRLCAAKFGSLVLFEGNTYRRVALYNAPTVFVEAQAREPVRPLAASPTLSRVAGTKRVVCIADILAEQPEEAIAMLGGARTVLIVPMLKDDRAVGAISIYRREVRPFTDKQMEVLRNFAAQAVIAIENTRLLRELRESLQQQTATADVLKVISRSPGQLEPVFTAMLENATRLCEAVFGSMLLLEGDVFRRVAMHNAPPMFEEFHKRTPVIDPQKIPDLRSLIETKKTVHVTDAAAINPDNPIAKYAKARTLVAVPMLREDVLVGAITIYRQEVRAFTDKQIELVTNFAAQAVIAIENARLLTELQARTEDLQESLQQQTATADVLKIISSSLGDLAPVFRAMLENAVHICEAKFGHMFLSEGEAFRVVALESGTLPYPDWLSEGSKLELRENPQGPLAQIAATRKIVHVGDLTCEAPYRERNPRMVALVESSGARTFLGVPMFRGEQLMGAIGIYRQEVRPFTDKQIALVQNFAAQAVIAIENARLLNELRQRTHELATSLDDLRNTQDRLVQTQKLASLGQLTAGIAHEIKNPLNFVNNFSAISVELIDELREALSEADLDAKLRGEINEVADMLQGNLDKVVQHGRRADSIVKNMLLHSRQGSQEHRPVDINAIVEESLNLAYHGARAEKPGFNITLERSLDPTAGEVNLFPQEITRVLLNLISNGFYAATKRKADANGGNYEPILAAATRNLGDSVEIRIRDNGTGIPPEVKEKMFNPFFTTKPAGEGTGLGLSISHDIIVKQHGGSIEVETEPGEYTEFRIILPRAAVFVMTSGAQS